LRQVKQDSRLRGTAPTISNASSRRPTLLGYSLSHDTLPDESLGPIGTSTLFVAAVETPGPI